MLWNPTQFQNLTNDKVKKPLEMFQKKVFANVTLLKQKHEKRTNSGPVP
jgi:hypothetical protein